MEYWWNEYWPFVVIGGIVAALVGLIVWAGVNEASKPSFSLAKSDWTCSAHHYQTSFVPVSTGKTTIMVPQNVRICDQWSRRR